MAELVNDLFRDHRHPSGREYTHKEVEEGITKAAGKKLIDASYISKLRTGFMKRPSLVAVEALCHFFPVDTDYFFPSIVALRQRQGNQRADTPLQAAFRSTGGNPDVLREQLSTLVQALTPYQERDQEQVDRTAEESEHDR